MPGPHYRETWVDDTNVNKTTLRNGMRDQTALNVTVAELQAMDTAAHRFAVVKTGTGEVAVFEYDAADTTTADNGATVLVSNDGNRFKRNSVYSDGGGGGTPTNIHLFTASGTYTKPAGLVRARVTVVGGGGAGGGAVATGSAEASCGGGGGSGAVGVKTLEAAVIGATETITIGAAGAGVAGDAGGDGLATTFTVTGGTNIVAGGGSGGNQLVGAAASINPTAAASAGTATGADYVSGQPGAFGLRASGTQALGGSGGSNPFGAGGFGNRLASVTELGEAGNAGLGFGAGGSGGINVGGVASAKAGGNGAPGLVIVEEFF